MDVLLSSVSVQGFKVGIWLLAVLVGVVVFFPSARNDRYKVALAAARGLYTAAFAFAIGSLSVMVYIMSHATDPRWSEGKNPLLKPNQVPTDVPFFEGIINAFNDLQGTVTGAANNVIAIENAFKTIPEFFELFVWAAAIAVALRLLLWRMVVHDEKRDVLLREVAERERREQEASDQRERDRRLNRQREAIWELQRTMGIDRWEDI